MDVSLDPAALGRGATRFTGQAEALRGHATSVADLTALRAAFAGAGETMWPAVAARLAEIERLLDVAQRHTADGGTVLRTAADGTPVVDQNNGSAIRNGGGDSR